jgi:mannose-6-phosphate isomerase-like protein (cupin superfamily)
VRAADVAGTRAGAPHARTLKHLVAPWTLGSTNLWVGLSEVDVGSSSNRHAHENEEVFFVLSGQGSVEVGDARAPLEPGTAVLIPGGEPHRLVNTGAEPLRVLCCASPAFERGGFEDVHELGR